MNILNRRFNTRGIEYMDGGKYFRPIATGLTPLKVLHFVCGRNSVKSSKDVYPI
jgi:hypothetical protein